MSTVQEEKSMVVSAGNDTGGRDQRDLSITGNSVSLVVDGGIGVIDVVGAIDKINLDLRSLGSRVDSMDNSLRSLKESAETIPAVKRDIESLGEAVQLMRRDIESVRRDALISRLVGIVGLWKLSLCSNNRSGVCYAWRLGDNLHEITAIYGDQVVVDVEGVKRVRVSIAHHLCGICPLFRPRAP